MKPDRRWVRWAVATILVLNLVDGILTLAIVHGGLATEANPLMAVPIGSWGAGWFMIIKLSLVSLGVTLLWRHRDRRSATIALGSMAAVYLALLVYHVQSVDALARMVAGSNIRWLS